MGQAKQRGAREDRVRRAQEVHELRAKNIMRFENEVREIAAKYGVEMAAMRMVDSRTNEPMRWVTMKLDDVVKALEALEMVKCEAKKLPDVTPCEKFSEKSEDSHG